MGTGHQARLSHYYYYYALLRRVLRDALFILTDTSRSVALDPHRIVVLSHFKVLAMGVMVAVEHYTSLCMHLASYTSINAPIAMNTSKSTSTM